MIKTILTTLTLCAALFLATSTLQAQTPTLPLIIELTDTPLADLYAQLNSAETINAASIAAATQAQLALIEDAQTALLADLATLDAQIIYRTQRVFNGIAIHAPASRVAQIAALPGVKAIHPLIAKRPDHDRSLPHIGAPQLWDGLSGISLTGDGIDIAIIDTGIDYLHKDFGGVGDGYAQNNVTTITDTAAYPNAKIIGGYDFTGDKYDADPENASFNPTRQPDPDPMDCYGGHGTHVAGTAAGMGVTSDGNTYAGPYNSSFHLGNLRIAPGVAPQARIYALKVFGCTGSSEITDLAIDWAVDPNQDGDLSDHVDVINMSLGSTYGALEDVSTIAANRAAAAGVIVVASAGNSGDVFYITGSPAIATGAISVAASRADTVRSSNTLADFSSRGPRRLDSAPKPDIAAPGSDIFSASYKSGDKGRSSNGTSMAAPHVAGGMVLLRQLHPDWSAQELKALVMNSAWPGLHLPEPLTATLYAPQRAGVGRLDLRTASVASVIAFDAADPWLVSLAFGTPEVTATLIVTRDLQIVNKGNTDTAFTVSYLSRVDTPGVEFSLPISQVTVTANSALSLPVVMTAHAAAMQHNRDPAILPNNARPNYWQSEESGLIQLTPLLGDAPQVHITAYAAPRPASTQHVTPTLLDYGRQVLAVQSLHPEGAGLAASQTPTGYHALRSIFQLTFESANTPPVALDDPRVAIGQYDHADLHYVGLAQGQPPITNTQDPFEQVVLYFAVATYADWSSPNQVEFNIYIDNNEDGVDDYRLYSSDRIGYVNRFAASDSFVSAVETLSTKLRRLALPLNAALPDGVYTALYNTNLLIIPVEARQIGVTQSNANFNYRVETKVEEVLGEVDRTPVLHWEAQLPGLAVNQPAWIPYAPALQDDQASTLPILLQWSGVLESGGARLLVFHHYNRVGERVEVVQIHNAPLKTFFPIAGK